MLPPRRTREVEEWAERDDARRVDVVVGEVVVALDVLDVHRRRDAGLLAEIAQVAL